MIIVARPSKRRSAVGLIAVSAVDTRVHRDDDEPGFMHTSLRVIGVLPDLGVSVAAEGRCASAVGIESACAGSAGRGVADPPGGLCGSADWFSVFRSIPVLLRCREPHSVLGEGGLFSPRVPWNVACEHECQIVVSSVLPETHTPTTKPWGCCALRTDQKER